LTVPPQAFFVNIHNGDRGVFVGTRMQALKSVVRYVLQNGFQGRIQYDNDDGHKQDRQGKQER
jgi:hypothetical protein